MVFTPSILAFGALLVEELLAPHWGGSGFGRRLDKVDKAHAVVDVQPASGRHLLECGGPLQVATEGLAFSGEVGGGYRDT